MIDCLERCQEKLFFNTLEKIAIHTFFMECRVQSNSNYLTGKSPGYSETSGLQFIGIIFLIKLDLMQILDIPEKIGFRKSIKLNK